MQSLATVARAFSEEGPEKIVLCHSPLEYDTKKSSACLK